MVAAIAAAKFAKKAAEETARNANVTEKGLRAYLWVETIVIRNDVGHPMSFVCTLRNDGQTPASKVIIKYALTAKSITNSHPEVAISEEQLTEYHRVTSQEPIKIPETVFKNPAWPPALHGGTDICLLLKIHITWEDVFGKPDESQTMFAHVVKIDSFIGSYRMMTFQAFMAAFAAGQEIRRNM